MTDFDVKSTSTRGRRARSESRPSGHTRMLDAAIDMLDRQPPSSITGRRLATRAGVHHTLIGQTFGGVASLVAAAYVRERDAFIAAELSDPERPLRPFAVAGYPEFWRAHVHFLLDPFDPEISQALAQNNPVLAACSVLQHHNPDASEMTCKAAAAAWWATQIGTLVYEKPLAQGLRISLRQRDLVRTLSAEGIEEFVTRNLVDFVPLPATEKFRRTSLSNPEGTRDAKEWALIEAAAELLTTRAGAGVSGRQLASRANVNYGLIHYYFGTKEAVFDQAFVHLHRNYVGDIVGGGDVRNLVPFSMISHAPFLRAWAGRELAEVAMPPISLVGMGLLLDHLLASRNVDRRSSRAKALAQSDALNAIALQLGWVLCRTNVSSVTNTAEGVLRGYLKEVYLGFLNRSV